MRLAKVSAQHGAHHLTARDQHRPVRLDPTVVQIEGDVVEQAQIDTIFLQILFHQLRVKEKESPV